uniref:Uncharacterized protein n=1 Tax=Eptatretus burgeri TaxID=7764 RepID=A0A8C4WYC2_EPTBU
MERSVRFERRPEIFEAHTVKEDGGRRGEGSDEGGGGKDCIWGIMWDSIHDSGCRTPLTHMVFWDICRCGRHFEIHVTAEEFHKGQLMCCGTWGAVCVDSLLSMGTMLGEKGRGNIRLLALYAWFALGPVDLHFDGVGHWHFGVLSMIHLDSSPGFRVGLLATQWTDHLC